MGNIVPDFNRWQKIKEQEQAVAAEATPKIAKHKQKIKGEKGIQSVKVKQKPGGFKVVAKNDANLVDGNTLTDNGWESLKGYLKSERALAGYYNMIKDPNKNKAIYKVKGGANRQVILFKIVPATKYPNITKQVFTQEEADASAKQAPAKPVETPADTEDKPGIGDGVDSTADTDTLKNSGFDPEKLPIAKSNEPQENAKAYQKLVIDKTQGTKLASTPLFKRFNKFGADGKFGKTTAMVTTAVKSGLGYKDTDGSTVDADLIKKLQTEKLNESYYWYGRIIEAFDMQVAIDKANELFGGSKPAPKKTEVPVEKPAEAAKPEDAAEKPTKNPVKKEYNNRGRRITPLTPVEKRVKSLKSAILGAGTNEAKIMSVINALKTKEDWNAIISKYPKLISDLNSDFNPRDKGDLNYINQINSKLKKLGVSSQLKSKVATVKRNARGRAI